MPATITIPPHYWSGETQIEFLLTDSAGRMYPAELADASGFVGGRNVVIADADGVIFDLPTNDEIPSAPGDGGSASTWTIRVQQGRYQSFYRVSISSASPPSTWNELIEAGTPVDPADIWSGRLLPDDAIAGEYTRKSVGAGWEAVPPPSGTGDVSGPAGAADGNMAVFDGGTGKVIRDGGPPGAGGGVPEPADDGIPKLRVTASAVSSWVDAGGASDPAQQNLETHKGSGDHDARNDSRYDAIGAAQSVADDLTTHKGSGDHDARYDAAGTAASGDAAHTSAFDHTRIPTAAQDNALDAASTLSGADPVAAISNVTAVSDDLTTHKASGDHDSRYDAAGTAASGDSAHLVAYQHDDIPTPDQANALDANPKLSAGDPVAAMSDVAGPSTDELVGVSATDTAGYLSPKLFSSDASVSFTVTGAADDQRIDVKSTGVGGGQSNTGENVGGAVEIYVGMNGTALQLRTLAVTSTVIPALNGDTIEISVPASTFDAFGSAATVDAALTTHKSSGDHDARYALVAPLDGDTYSQREGAWVVSPVTPIGAVWTQYTWSSDTSATSPASGGVKANNADQALATALYVHEITGGGNSAHDIWMSLQAGDYLGVWEDQSDREGIYYSVAGPAQNNTGWYTIPIAVVPGSTGGIDDGQAVAAFTMRDPQNRNPVGGAQFSVLRKSGAGDHITEWHTLVPGDINAEPAFSKNSAFNKDFGGIVDTVCQGNDSRLSDARAPTAHAASHMGGADPITPAGLGAVPDARTVNTGVGLSGGSSLDSDLTLFLNNTAVLPAEYTNPTITIDSQGRITAAANGVGGSGLHADLTDTATDGHPGTVITIAAGVQGNAVSIAADGSLQDSGVPPGGATDLGTTYTATTFTITSSSGQNTPVEQAGTGGNAGAMSGADKSKLDGIEAGAQANVGTDLTNSPGAIAVTVESSTGANTSLPAATQTLAGVLSGADKAKLDGVATGAEVNTVDAVNGSNSITVSPTTGTPVVGLQGDAASPGNSKYWGTSGAGVKGFHDLPAGGGGDIDGSQVIDWDDARQAIVGSGGETFDLDVGHFFSGTLTASETINFTSTRGHAYTSWDVILATGGFTPTFQFGGVSVTLPKDYSVSADATYWFTFRKNGAAVYMTNMEMQ